MHVEFSSRLSPGWRVGGGGVCDRTVGPCYLFGEP